MYLAYSYNFIHSAWHLWVFEKKRKENKIILVYKKSQNPQRSSLKIVLILCDLIVVYWVFVMLLLRVKSASNSRKNKSYDKPTSPTEWMAAGQKQKEQIKVIKIENLMLTILASEWML